MNRNDSVYRTYVDILQRELICAMGCTEPIALAYCAATARLRVQRLERSRRKSPWKQAAIS